MAWTDRLLLTAQLGTVIDTADTEELLRELAELCAEREVFLVVVGLPRNMDGTEGAQAKAVRELIVRFRERLGVPVLPWDERLSSLEADEVLDQKGYRRTTKRGRQRRKAERDVVAASLILAGFLQVHGDGIRERGLAAVLPAEEPGAGA